jgi:hypothetical protein
VKTLTLYSRPDCHLCELMLRELQGLLRGRAELRRVDISHDLDLIERYGLRIPVLACGDEEISGYPLDAAAVERFLSSSS